MPGLCSGWFFRLDKNAVSYMQKTIEIDINIFGMRSEGRIDVRTEFRACQFVNDLPDFNR